MRAEVGKDNKDVKRFQTHNITELNTVVYEATYGTTERRGNSDRQERKKN